MILVSLHCIANANCVTIYLKVTTRNFDLGFDTMQGMR